MSFSDIPIRENGQEIDSSWFNTIRSMLVAIFPGAGSNISAPFTIANNQSSYADITGLLLDNTEATSWVLKYEIYRKTDSAERHEVGTMTISYKPIDDAFTLSRVADHGDDAMNIDDAFFVTTLGQVQYKSDNISGSSYVGKFSYLILVAFKGV